MSDNTTTVEYNVVRDGVSKIETLSNRMDGIFTEFDGSMNKVLSPENFAGIAADAVGTDYATLKSQYKEIIGLVNRFADEYRRAAGIMKEHESKLEQKSQALNSKLERMN